MSDKKELRQERAKQHGLPQYTFGEELLNSISHGFGAVASLVGMIFLILKAQSGRDIASVIIFSASSIALYTVSCVYHGMHVSAAKKYLRIADHCSIFLMIGGCYTPFIFMILEGWVQIAVLIGIWATGIVGITLNLIDLKRFSKWSMACYIIMGWFAVAVIPVLIRKLERNALVLLFAGGLCYTVGAVVYGLGKKLKWPYVHTFYHFLILAGTALHYAMVYVYMI